jgi:hypothetical protein
MRAQLCDRSGHTICELEAFRTKGDSLVHVRVYRGQVVFCFSTLYRSEKEALEDYAGISGPPGSFLFAPEEVLP